MPRHLISDAHEWINEIPTVPHCPPFSPQHSLSSFSPPRGRFPAPLQRSGPSLLLRLSDLSRQPVGMAAPPPFPLHDPPSTNPLPHPTKILSPSTSVPISDLARIGPDPAASGSSAVPATSVHLLRPQTSHQRPSPSSRSSSKTRASARVVSRSESSHPPSSSSVIPPPDLQGEDSSLQVQRSAAAPLPVQLQAAPAPTAPVPGSAPVLAVAAAVSGSSAGLIPSHPVLPFPPLSASSAPPSIQQADPISQPSSSLVPVLLSVQSSVAGSQPFPAATIQQPSQLATVPLHPPSFLGPAQPLAHSIAAATVQQPVQQPVQQAAVPLLPPSSSVVATLSGSATLAPLRSSAPQQQTYAQVARNSRGTGFVRSHANYVESFARLPRTGINIICDTIDGMPSFSFVNSELPMVEELYANALVMKFHGGRPSLEASHKEIQSWGIEHPFSIGPLSSRAFLLRFQDNVDLLKVLTRPSSILITFSYKVYRWHNLCHMKEDSCFAPVWISLPRLPLQCFVPEFLESVANNIGRFLCFDKATATLARPSAARICVEIDLRKTPPPFIWVGLFEGFKQLIIYERMPKYCNLCHVIGHMAEVCRKTNPAAPPYDAEQRVPFMRGRPSAAPQHTPRHASSSQQFKNSATAHPAPPLSSPIHQSTAAPPPVDAHLQSHLSVSQLQRAPAAEMPASSPSLQQSLLILPSTASPSADNELIQPSTAMVQRVPISAAPSSNSHAPSTTLSSASGLMAPSVTQPTSPLKPISSKQHKGKQRRKSVSFAFPPPQFQSNIQANSDFWEAANRQLAIIEQARITTSSVHSSMHIAGIPPSESEDQVLHTIPTPLHTSHSSVESDSGSSIAADTAPSSPKSQHSASQSTKLMPFNVGNNASLPQPQAEALERFKSKILAQTRAQGKLLSIPNSVNHFEALLDGQSDEDDYVASYNSDTDDGGVEPIEMGYQSADGRSSYNHKDFAPSSMKINKRHPNMPLNVRLRSRKSLHPSTP